MTIKIGKRDHVAMRRSLMEIQRSLTHLEQEREALLEILEGCEAYLALPGRHHAAPEDLR